jgi:hypothetical protein
VANAGIWAGNNPVVDSGSVILGPDEEPLTIKIDNLTFKLFVIDDRSLPPITPNRVSDNLMEIKFNIWQGTNPTFKFQVGHVRGGNLHLAVRITSQFNYRIIAYTFTQVSQ